MNFLHAFVLATGVCLAQWAHAQVAVTEPWVRASVPGQETTAAYMQIKSTEQAVLVSAASPVAGMAEVHESSMEGGMMKMREIARLALPAGKIVELKPGGYHIMLMNVVKPLKAGDMVPITLTVETTDKKRRTVEVQAQVREPGRSGAQHKPMH